MKKPGRDPVRKIGHVTEQDGTCDHCGLRTTGNGRDAGHAGVVHEHCWDAWMKTPRAERILQYAS
jgi:hypothetical protein